MPVNGTTLADLRTGQRAVIAAVDCRDAQVQRLMTLGLVEGAEVELAGVAIGGDPLELRVFGHAISIRQEQAQRFALQAESPGDGGD